MSSFTTPLVVSPTPDGRRWKLFHAFKYHVGYRWSKRIITVPVGFVTDFASIPRPLWWLLPAWGKYGKAAVIHDYLYKIGRGTRKEADDIFREAMAFSGVKPWKISVMYWAVRLFGWLAWRGNNG